MITDNFVWKSLVTCFMCKRGKGRITPTAQPKLYLEPGSADSKINKLVISEDGGDAPLKNALDSLPSNGISDDGSRMMPMESAIVDRSARGVPSVDEISDEPVAKATKTRTITVGAEDSLQIIEDVPRVLDVEKIEAPRDERNNRSDDAAKLPPIYQHLTHQRRRSSVAVNKARPRSSGPYARISFIQEQRALALVNYKRERLEAS